MLIGGRKLSELLPAPVRPLARSLGRERLRAQFAYWDKLLAAHNVLGRGIRHVHGPEDIRPNAGELVVLCLVRNGVAHLPTFLAHYERLGAKHIVLLDNGSTDETVAMASASPRTSIYTTRLPFGRYETAFKRWLVRRFGTGDGWCIVADMDELFDYPFSRELPLRQFLRYLDAHGYDAVTAQNLEMIPRESIAAIQGQLSHDLTATHRFYDLSDLRQASDQFWLERNVFDSPGHYTHTGGIWETIFGYRGSKLTKQPLMRPRGGLTVFPYDVHFVADAHIADVSGVFRHYKYTGKFIAHVQEELERRQHYGKAEIFDHYRRVLDANPDLTLFRPTAREWDGAEDLLESGFLIASPRYLEWVRAHGRAGAPRASGEPTTAAAAMTATTAS